MILNKIYKQQQLTLTDIKQMLIIFFKIKDVRVKETSINSFIKYLTTLNNHSFIEQFNKFKPLEDIIYEDLIPTIENHLEVIKTYKKDQFIKFTYNEKKYQELL